MSASVRLRRRYARVREARERHSENERESERGDRTRELEATTLAVPHHKSPPISPCHVLLCRGGTQTCTFHSLLRPLGPSNSPSHATPSHLLDHRLVQLLARPHHLDQRSKSNRALLLRRVVNFGNHCRIHVREKLCVQQDPCLAYRNPKPRRAY